MRLFLIAASAVLCISPELGLAASDYPIRPIHIFVGTSAGGAVDIMARALAEDLGNALRGTFVVINKDGRNGTIAAEQVVTSKPDGYTLGFQAAGAFVSDPFTPEGVSYKIDDVDFLCQVFEPAVALAVQPDSPFKTVADVIQAAKQKPGAVSVGTVGPGSIPGIAVRLLEENAGIHLNQIPYSGDAQNVTALLGHQIDAAVPGLTTVTNKGVPILAIFSAQRSRSHSEIPTMKELGYPIVKVGMVGIYAPAGMPGSVRTKLVNACNAAHAGPRLQEVSHKLGQDIIYLGPTEWRQHIMADRAENKVILDELYGKKEKTP
jgi:tripartite-type tricarboxylate transporter receptor subunit TctC